MPPHQGLWLKRAPQSTDPPAAFSLQLQRQLYNAELAILGHLGTNPRIVSFRGVSTAPEGLLLDEYPLGNLGAYVLAHPATPRATRLQWVIDIASGIRYLHSKGVAWNDGHFGNMLLTRDLRVVLADFGIAACPALGINAIVYPGGAWRSPWPGTPRQDVFALATAAFVLLMDRWPHTRRLEITLDETDEVCARHARGEFDRALDGPLGRSVMRCWRGEYDDSDRMLAGVVRACEASRRR